MILTAKRRGILAVAAGAAVLALGLSACSSTPSDGGASKTPAASTKTLRVWAGSQTPIVANFNPFAPTVLHAALGPIYEPLFFFNKTADTKPVGELGESYEFNADGTVLTIKLKSGVTWNDGKTFTAKDVAYTFNFKGNANTALVSATASDDTTVVLTYKTPQFTSAFQILGGTYIIPEHVWSAVKDFTTFTATPSPSEPVPTSLTLSMTRRTRSWQTPSSATRAFLPSRRFSTSALTPTSRRRTC